MDDLRHDPSLWHVLNSPTGSNTSCSQYNTSALLGCGGLGRQSVWIDRIGHRRTTTDHDFRSIIILWSQWQQCMSSRERRPRNRSAFCEPRTDVICYPDTYVTRTPLGMLGRRVSVLVAQSKTIAPRFAATKIFPSGS